VPFCVVAFQECDSFVLTLAPYFATKFSTTLLLSEAKVMFPAWSEEPLKTHTPTPGTQEGEETNTTVSLGVTGEGKPTVAVEPPPEKEKLAALGVGVAVRLEIIPFIMPALRVVSACPGTSIPERTTTTTVEIMRTTPTIRRTYSNAPWPLARRWIAAQAGFISIENNNRGEV
jgi:hypothetical protein